MSTWFPSDLWWTFFFSLFAVLSQQVPGVTVWGCDQGNAEVLWKVWRGSVCLLLWLPQNSKIWFSRVSHQNRQAWIGRWPSFSNSNGTFLSGVQALTTNEKVLDWQSHTHTHTLQCTHTHRHTLVMVCYAFSGAFIDGNWCFQWQCVKNTFSNAFSGSNWWLQWWYNRPSVSSLFFS